MHVVAVHRETDPNRTVMAENQLQIGGFAENTHVGEHAVVHEMMRADTIAAKFLADEFVAPLRFLDFADHGCDDQVALKLHSSALEGFHGLRIANQRALHVVDAESVDEPVLDDGLRLVADARKKFFAASIGSVHVAVEHQAFGVAGTFPESNHVPTSFFDFLPGNGEPRFFQRTAHVAAHFQLFPGGAGSVDHVATHSDQLVFTNLRQDGFGQLFLHGVRFPSR